MTGTGGGPTDTFKFGEVTTLPLGGVQLSPRVVLLVSALDEVEPPVAPPVDQGPLAVQLVKLEVLQLIFTLAP